ERTSDDDGVRMLVLAIRAKEHNFVLRQIPPENSVLIEDLAFNSFLAVANRALEGIARDLGRPVGHEVLAHLVRTNAARDRLWGEPASAAVVRSKCATISGTTGPMPHSNDSGTSRRASTTRGTPRAEVSSSCRRLVPESFECGI